MEPLRSGHPETEENKDLTQIEEQGAIVYDLGAYRQSKEQPDPASQQFLQAFDVMLALEMSDDLQMAVRLDDEIEALAAESPAEVATLMEWMAKSESVEVRETATYHLPNLLEEAEEPEEDTELDRQRLRQVWMNLMRDEEERISTEAQQSFVMAYRKIDAETFLQLRGQVDWQNQTDYAGRAGAAQRYFEITRS